MDSILAFISSKEFIYFLSPLFYVFISYVICKVLIYSTVNYKQYPFRIQELTMRDILGLYAWNVIGMAVLCLIFCNDHWYLLFKMWILVIPVSAYSTYKGLKKHAGIVERNKNQR
jgi:hypothetical protein